ncbi:CGG triplet repeat-binding protein 1-like [Heterodontus francisci]|uniref:CGG triplet repeat-binding protein 1-like n=1 Tax=Heterodontus francisci TaxID=7792 RepID=UPI00355B5E6E
MSKSKTATTITAAHRVKEFGSQFLHANGRILFCISYNVLLDHTCRAMVQCHLESESHGSRKRALLENKHAKKQATISSLFKKLAESSENSQLVTMELVDAFATANISLEKLDRPKLQVFIQCWLSMVNTLPIANSRRDVLFDMIFQSLKRTTYVPGITPALEFIDHIAH